MNITECGHLPDIMDTEPHSLTSKSPGDLRGPHAVRDVDGTAIFRCIPYLQQQGSTSLTS